MQPRNQATGVLGEAMACDELERRGYVVLDRRYRTRFGELDIVADDRGTVVFIEVKARASARHGAAAESIPPWKRRRIAAMALDYLRRARRLNAPCRFDVVAIDGIGSDRPEVRVIRDAFLVE